MITIDVNLLLYAHAEQSVWHEPAREWLQGVLTGSETIGLPWSVIQGFLRIATDARARQPPLAAAQAMSIVEGWFASGNVIPLRPGERHWEVFARMVAEGQCRGPLIPDAHIAAVTIEHGGHLYSTDRDFSRFPGLRWSNPLTSK